MFTFIIKNAVKSYASDLTLIAATQIALFKKIIVYMEEKYLVCYPVYKCRLTSGQSHDMKFEKRQSQCTLQFECGLAKRVTFLTRPQEPPRPAEMCTKRPHALSPGTRVESARGQAMKKFWNNQNRSEEAHDSGQYTQSLFSETLSVPLGRQGPVLRPGFRQRCGGPARG